MARSASSPPAPALTPEERDRLVEKHLDYARALAAKLRREISADLPIEELSAYAARGLVEAASRYDPARGVAFTTFSYYRVRGAIFDGLREIGWLNRSDYARYQASADDLLGNLADRQPVAATPATDLETELGEIAGTLDQLATVFVTSLDARSERELADPRAPDATQALEQQQARRALRAAIATLPEREQKLVDMHYYQGQTLEAAGAALGLSRSWASRLHARAIKLLTAALDPAFG